VERAEIHVQMFAVIFIRHVLVLNQHAFLLDAAQDMPIATELLSMAVRLILRQMLIIVESVDTHALAIIMLYQHVHLVHAHLRATQDLAIATEILPMAVRLILLLMLIIVESVDTHALAIIMLYQHVHLVHAHLRARQDLTIATELLPMAVRLIPTHVNNCGTCGNICPSYNNAVINNMIIWFMQTLIL
jgi:hypothetical protein